MNCISNPSMEIGDSQVKKTHWIFLSIMAGVAAAALHASIVMLTPLAAVLFYLAPLPLFIVGLGYGPVSAAVGAAAGAAAIGSLWGLKAGVFFAISSALGPVILCRLALISRRSAGSRHEGEAVDRGIEWYPEGRLTLWTALFAGAVLTLVIVMVGPDAENFRATLKDLSTRFAEPLLKDLPEQQRPGFAQMIDFLVMLAPAASAAAWFAAMTINLLLAARLVTRWGISLRPWAAFSSLAFPRKACLAVAAFGVASMLPGTAGLIGSVYAAPFCAAFALLGLAVIHHLLLRHPARTSLLAGLYAALILLSWLVVLPLIALGIVETGFNLRARSNPLPPANRNM
jgi:hypothetical protein